MLDQGRRQNQAGARCYTFARTSYADRSCKSYVIIPNQTVA